MKKAGTDKEVYLMKSLVPFVLISIVVISAAMHFKHFEKDLMGMHVWRQSQTQSTIISFYEEDMNIFTPRRNDRGDGDGIFRMEFPLMQWLVAGTYKIFGNHLFISRIWMFFIGIFSVLGMYKLLKVLFDNEILAVMGAWAFNFSPSFYYHTINPMPDNLALFFSIWGLAMFFHYIRSERQWLLLLSGLSLSLSALCKLPFILYFTIPLMYFILKAFQSSTLQSSKFQPSTFKSSIIKVSGIALFALPPLAWYVSVVPQWQGNGIVQGMFENKASTDVLLGNFQHHLFITLPDLLLNYGSVLFFLAGFYFVLKNRSYKNIRFTVFAALGILLSLYFLFELNMIGKSHDYYLFPFLPLLFILVSYGAYHLFMRKSRIIKAFVILLLFILPLTAYLRIDKRWNPEKPGFNKDLLVYKNELREAVPKDALCIAGNDNSHFIFFYYIDKKGWGFDYDILTGERLGTMITAGARYLYSDSRHLENRPEISFFLDELILEKGSVKIFRLKQGFQP